MRKIKEIRTIAIISSVIILGLMYQTEVICQSSLTPEQERHVQRIIADLDSTSDIKHMLVLGERGNGVKEQWMTEMEKIGAKRVTADVRFRWYSPNVLKIDVVRLFYFGSLENGETNLLPKTFLVIDPIVQKAAKARLKMGFDNVLKQYFDLVGRRKAVCGSLNIYLLADETLPSYTSIPLIEDGRKRPKWCKK